MGNTWEAVELPERTIPVCISVGGRNGSTTRSSAGLPPACLGEHYRTDAVAADPNVNGLHSSPEFNGLIKKYSTKKP
jgi:hypothetical protein